MGVNDECCVAMCQVSPRPVDLQLMKYKCLVKVTQVLRMIQVLSFLVAGMVGFPTIPATRNSTTISLEWCGTMAR